MRTKLILVVIILLVFTASFLGKGFLAGPPQGEVRDARRAQRIISLAPSITETLFALELGDRVVGVTRYCDYPPEANQKARVGGYLNPNFEAVVALRPDLVVTLAAAEQSLSAFDKLRLRTLVVCHKSVGGILDSITTIGRACGAEAKAHQIVSDIQRRIQCIERQTAGLERPRVMFAIERTLGSGRLEDVYVAGCDGYFDTMIWIAGGRNAYRQGAVRFPVVSTEGLLKMNPQVIIDMVPGLARGQFDSETILADWQQLEQVEAVASGRVYLLDDDYAFVPGPRFIMLLEKLARMIHPEINWAQ